MIFNSVFVEVDEGEEQEAVLPSTAQRVCNLPATSISKAYSSWESTEHLSCVPQDRQWLLLLWVCFLFWFGWLVFWGVLLGFVFFFLIPSFLDKSNFKAL